jgi:hypothetical protein
MEGVAAVRRWYAGGLAISVSVNVSTRDLLDRDLPRFVDEAIRRRVPADCSPWK